MSNKLKFGTTVQHTFGYDLWQNPQVKQLIQIHRLEPNDHFLAQPNERGHFSPVKLIRVEMTQSGIARVPHSGTRTGIEPYAMSFHDKHDAKDLWLNQWTPQSRVDVACPNLFEEGAPDAMRLLCKAQEFAESGCNELHKEKYKPICEDDFIWGNLEMFSRLMLGLYVQGVFMIEGHLQDFQSVSKFQFSPTWIRHMWDTSEMLRSLSQVEIAEGALSAG